MYFWFVWLIATKIITEKLGTTGLAACYPRTQEEKKMLVASAAAELKRLPMPIATNFCTG